MKGEASNLNHASSAGTNNDQCGHCDSYGEPDANQVHIRGKKLQ